jgi:RimJ/RimL family protein N-acetyltransferase
VVFAPDYPILTERLLLRPFTQDDFEDFHAIYSHPDVMRYLYDEPRDRATNQELLAARIPMVRIDDDSDRLSLAMVRRDTDRMIGLCMLFQTSAEHNQGEIGYVLHPDHHRQGFGTEVAPVLLRLGFEGAKFHRIVGRCDARNVGSYRVLASAGMRREAHLRENEFVKGEWVDELIYAMLATEWHAAAR